MKKTMLVLTAVLFVTTSFILSAAGSGSAGREGSSTGSGYGGGSVQPGPEFTTPRGFGEEASQGETEAHERMFDENAAGAWSKDPEPGKDKPSSSQ